MMIPNQKGQMEEQIDFSKTSEICCEACGGKTFKQTLLMRRMSPLASPSGQEMIIPMAVFACDLLHSKCVPMILINSPLYFLSFLPLIYLLNLLPFGNMSQYHL